MNKEKIEDIKCALDSENLTIIGLERKNIAKYINYLEQENERLHNIIKEIRELINNFDVFKEFTFPLMKRDEEQQVKSSIDYEWRKSIKEPILEILDKEGKE